MHKGKKMLKVKARPEPDKDQKCQKKTNLSQINCSNDKRYNDEKGPLSIIKSRQLEDLILLYTPEMNGVSSTDLYPDSIHS